MDIKSAQYISVTLYDGTKQNGSIKAVIGEQTWSVPIEPDNAHYQAILEWAKEDGNEIQAAE